jgi:hypothetical protein
MAKKLMLFATYFVVSFGVLNLAFPIAFYFRNFPNYSRSYIVSSFLLLALTTTLLAAVAFPFCVRGDASRWAG